MNATANQTARWNRLKATDYPEAGYWFDETVYCGALRHHDGVIRQPDFKSLIDALLNREAHSAGPNAS